MGILYAIFFGTKYKSGQSSVVSADRHSSILASPVATGSNISQTVNLAPTVNVGYVPPAVSHDDKPTPVEIASQLRAIPLAHREDLASSFYGLKVRWPVRLLDLQEFSELERRVRNTDVTHRILVHFEEARAPIGADLNIERFPRLKTSQQGTPLKISGTISYVSDMGSISMTDVDITSIEAF